MNVIICFKLQFEGLDVVNLAKEWRQLDRWNNYTLYQLYNVNKQNMNMLHFHFEWDVHGFVDV